MRDFYREIILVDYSGNHYTKIIHINDFEVSHGHPLLKVPIKKLIIPKVTSDNSTQVGSYTLNINHFDVEEVETHINFRELIAFNKSNISIFASVRIGSPTFINFL